MTLDVRTGEIWKDGARSRLQDHPLAILTLLIEHPSELVNREQLRHRLWPDGTVVDFEHGVNSAMRRLREALGDDAENPRFIETVPRRGYRLIAPVHALPTAVRAETPEATRREAEPPSNAPLALHRPEVTPSTPGTRTALAQGGALERKWWLLVLVTILGFAALAILQVTVRPRLADGVTATYSIVLPDDYPLSPADALVPGADEAVLALSRDGTRLAYVAQTASGTEICVRDNRTGKVTPVPGTAGGRTPFFSPDSRQLAFFAGAHLKKVSLASRSVTELAEVQGGEGGAWSDDRFIYFSLTRQEGLFRVPETGGPVMALRGGGPGRRPAPLNGGGDILVTLGESEMGCIRDGQLHEVGLGFSPRYVESGHLLYALPGRLMAVRFGRSSLDITGTPVVIAADLRTGGYVAQFDVAADGTLVYAPLTPPSVPSLRLTVITHLFDELRRTVRSDR